MAERIQRRRAASAPSPAVPDDAVRAAIQEFAAEYTKMAEYGGESSHVLCSDIAKCITDRLLPKVTAALRARTGSEEVS